MNTHYLQFRGYKVNIPEPLEKRTSYHVSLEGKIIDIHSPDAEDGTDDLIYIFKPTTVELLKPTGEIIKAKDKHRDSQLTRLAIRGYWLDNNLEEPEEDFYHRIQVAIRHNLDSIISFLKL